MKLWSKEIKQLRCGCGSEARIKFQNSPGGYEWKIKCTKCERHASNMMKDDALKIREIFNNPLAC